MKNLKPQSLIKVIAGVLIGLATTVKQVAAQGASPADIFGAITPPAGVSAYDAQAAASGGGLGLMFFFSNIVKILTIVAGLWVLVNFLMAGFSIVTGGGDSGSTKKAYDKILYSVIGLVIIVASYTLIALVSLIVFGQADYILNPVINGAK